MQEILFYCLLSMKALLMNACMPSVCCTGICMQAFFVWLCLNAWTPLSQRSLVLPQTDYPSTDSHFRNKFFPLWLYCVAGSWSHWQPPLNDTDEWRDFTWKMQHRYTLTTLSCSLSRFKYDTHRASILLELFINYLRRLPSHMRSLLWIYLQAALA